MAFQIADTACVDPSAVIADGVEIGPFCIIGPQVRIGPNTLLSSHVFISGPCILGEGNRFEPFTTVGRAVRTGEEEPRGVIQIGDHNRFGPGVAIESPTDPREVTRIGSCTFIAPQVHIAPSCVIEDRARLETAVVLGANVAVGEGSVLSTGVSVHSRVTIGKHCFIGGPSRVFHDVPPFLLADGHPSRIRCLHVIGLKRLGVSAESIRALHEAHRLVYRGKVEVEAAADQLCLRGQSPPEVNLFLSFIRDQRNGRHGRARDRLFASVADDEAA
jgi:UDP-N-acetylglucosamine acyltransferase